MPLLSFVIPVFNTAPYLAKCLQSVANQTLENIEVILVDDGSTDKSWEICHEFVNNYPNFKCYTKINEGQGVARNYGLQKAQGEFICFVDSDDWIEPSMCEDMVQVMNQSNADFANFGLDFVTSEGRIVKSIHHFEVKELVGENLFINALIDRYIMSTSCNKIYRRSFLSDNKILFPPIRANEDLFFSRAIAYYSNKTVFVSKVYYHALVRSGSTSRSMSAEMFHISKHLVEYEYDFFFSRLQQDDCQLYFSAHIVKFFSYLLIQAAFRISDYTEYRSCFDIANDVNFNAHCSRKDVISILGIKGHLMVFLCRYPMFLRLLAIITKKIGLSSFVY